MMKFYYTILLALLVATNFVSANTIGDANIIQDELSASIEDQEPSARSNLRGLAKYSNNTPQSSSGSSSSGKCNMCDDDMDEMIPTIVEKQKGCNYFCMLWNFAIGN